MNANAKRRAWSGGPKEPETEREEDPSPRAPLVAAEGPQIFVIDAEGAGERLTVTSAVQPPGAISPFREHA